MTNTDVQLPQSPERPPGNYARDAEYDEFVIERDVRVPMRDGVHLVVDIYRPKTEEPLPALLAFAIYNKEIQGPDVTAVIPPQPSWSTRVVRARRRPETPGSSPPVATSTSSACRVASARRTAAARASATPTTSSSGSPQQPWCDGQVGMVGVSGFGAEQMHVARQRPPHLKAIFPFDPRGAYGTLGGFRDEYPGGVVHLFRYLVGHFGVFHQDSGAPGELPPESERCGRRRWHDDDYQLYPHVYNVVVDEGPAHAGLLRVLINPYVSRGRVERSRKQFDREHRHPRLHRIRLVRLHVQDPPPGRAELLATTSRALPKKLLFAGPAHLERPFHGLHGEILRWYDHWLKGLDTGVLDEPPVRYWLMGANRGSTRAGLAAARRRSWTKFYLESWERLRTDPSRPAQSSDDRIPPDTFVQMPLTQTQRLNRLRYLSTAAPGRSEVVGPSALKLFASIDQDDTNWIAVLSDVGPDPSVQTVRDGERKVPEDLPEAS